MIDWFGLYGESWQGEIVSEAFAHPAKFSRALIRQIYKHLLERGYIQPGSKVVDPFGGVALGALDAMQNGLHWYGLELEPKFVDLGNQNIALWNGRYNQWFTNWGTAQLIQGDSRQLAAVLGSADGCVTSPPYANLPTNGAQRFSRHKMHDGAMNGPELYGNTAGQLGAMPEGNHADAIVSSPPFGEGETRNRSEYQDGYVADMMSRAYTQDKQGTTPGNLAGMRATEEGFAAAISSPPFLDGGMGDSRPFGGIKQPKEHWNETTKTGGLTDYGTTSGQLGSMPQGDFDACLSSPPYSDMVKSGEGPGAYGPGNAAYKKIGGYKPGANNSGSQAEYGDTPGQLAGMANGGFEAAVGSPPYEGSIGNGTKDGKHTGMTHRETPGGDFGQSLKAMSGIAYGETSGQLGTETGDTFWAAARQIVEQVYMVLRPGGVAVWVCKDFVRNKERVPFSDQWQQLCQACGFVPVERIRAWVVEEKGTQGNLFTGEFETKTVERKSFFRRLAERKGSPRIDYEEVLILRKPSE